MKSFSQEFDKLREMGDSVFVLRGSSIIVEILPAEEIKTASGLIMSAPKDHARGGINEHRLDVARVLMTGPGYWQDDGTYEALDVKPGAVVILPQFSTQLISTFPGITRPTENRLGLVKMDNIMAYYPSEEAYNEAKAKLN